MVDKRTGLALLDIWFLISSTPQPAQAGQAELCAAVAIGFALDLAGDEETLELIEAHDRVTERCAIFENEVISMVECWVRRWFGETSAIECPAMDASIVK